MFYTPQELNLTTVFCVWGGGLDKNLRDKKLGWVGSGLRFSQMFCGVWPYFSLTLKTVEYKPEVASGVLRSFG